MTEPKYKLKFDPEIDPESLQLIFSLFLPRGVVQNSPAQAILVEILFQNLSKKLISYNNKFGLGLDNDCDW